MLRLVKGNYIINFVFETTPSDFNLKPMSVNVAVLIHKSLTRHGAELVDLCSRFS